LWCISSDQFGAACVVKPQVIAFHVVGRPPVPSFVVCKIVLKHFRCNLNDCSGLSPPFYLGERAVHGNRQQLRRGDELSARRVVRRVLLPAIAVLGALFVVVVSQRGDPSRVPVSTVVTGAGLGEVFRGEKQVTVSRVSIPLGGGFVAVYADAGGVPGKRLGVSSHLDGGDHTDVAVAISDSAKTYWAVVHRDQDADGQFDSSIDLAASDPMTGLVVTRQTN
jgi:hypothetical protein